MPTGGQTETVWRQFLFGKSMRKRAKSSGAPITTAIRSAEILAETGAGYVIQGDSEGNLFFIDGLTGEILNTFEMDGNIEATPAVYNDILVLGTRNCSIYAVRIE